MIWRRSKVHLTPKALRSAELYPLQSSKPQQTAAPHEKKTPVHVPQCLSELSTACAQLARAHRRCCSQRSRGCPCRTSQSASPAVDHDEAQDHAPAPRGSRTVAAGGCNIAVDARAWADRAAMWGRSAPACLLSLGCLQRSPTRSTAPDFTPARRAGRSGGHWACTVCASVAVGGHGDVQGCAPLGRRKAGRS